MGNLDLYQMRLKDSRKISKSKLVDTKIKTFKRALASSYNSEIVVSNNNEFDALITGIPTTPKIGKKNFATLLDNNCETGDELYWPANDSYWLITEHDDTEGAIFQGSVQRALYELKWKDPVLNKVYSARACVKGPDETTISDGVKHSILFDTLTDSLYLIVSSKVEGSEYLDRYFELMVDGRKWRIEVVDAMTRSNLLYMQLMESPKDRDRDTEDMVDGKEEVIFTMNSSLDNISFVDLNSEIDFLPILLRNGRILDRGEVEISVNNCTHNDNKVLFNQLGLSSITVNFKDYNEIFKIELSVVSDNTESIIVEEIIGNSSVKTLSTNVYTAVDTLNGIPRSTTGVWSYDNNYFEEVSIGDTEIKLKSRNKTGTTFVRYVSDTADITKEVKIVPLFGGS